MVVGSCSMSSIAMTKLSGLRGPHVEGVWRTGVCCAALIALTASPSLAQQGRHVLSASTALADLARTPESSSSLAEASELIDEFRSIGQFREYKESLGYGLRLSHYIADARFDLPVLQDSRFQLSANLGIGATTLRTSDGYSAVLASDDLMGTYVSLRGGISLAYRVSPHCRVFVGAQEYLHFDHQAELLQQPEVSVRDLSDAALTFPITFGLTVNIN